MADTDQAQEGSEEGKPESYDKRVAKGAGVNILGNIGKLLFPLYWILITRVFGPEAMGLFLLAFTSLEVVNHVTVAGFNDGVLMFASRAHHGAGDDEAFYRVVANGLLLTVGLCLLIVLAGQLVGPDLASRLFPGKDVWPALQVLLWTLPITGLTTIVIAATKSLLLMHWEALLVNTLRPLLLILTMLAWYLAGDRSTVGLAWSYLLAVGMIGVAALAAFRHHFSLRALWRHVASFMLHGDLIRFSIPQNINMTFNNFITQIDVLMLGAFKFKSALIGYYGIGAQIIANLTQIQGSIGGAYAPAIARQHVAGDRRGLNESFTRVSRWAATALWPVVFLVLFFRAELLQIWHPTFVGASLFMVVLAARPVINAGFGISGNIIVMTGHSLWNLFNSVTVGLLNVGLNALLIPRLGLEGAALATVVSSSLITGLQLIELSMLLRVRTLPGRLYKPYLAAAPGICALVSYGLGATPVLTRVLAAVVSLVLYVVLLWMLRFEQEDRDVFFARWTQREG